MASADYVAREALRDALYEADAITMKGVAIINQFPAADVRPVVRGKWEDVFVRDYSTNINGGMELHVASMFCPICHRWHNEVYHYGNPTETAHFCPNCGADMREES